MEKQNYIGRKVKGFSFDDGVHKVVFNEEMKKYIGLHGEIVFYSTDYLAFKVIFEDGNHWFYPDSLIDQYLVPEEQDETELRDQFAMQALNGLISSQQDRDPAITYYTPEGREYLANLSYLISDAMLKSRKEVYGE